MVHTLAHQAGLAATFMPKPFANLTGSGLHLHSSLWDAQSGTELFADPADPRGLGLSQLAYHYIGGLIEHGPALAAVTCPTVNSYKRFGVGAPQSGATWAPAYATYGGNNRTQMLRVPEGGRVENRACDGAANPYLAMAAQLAAGLDGIDRGLDPGEPNRDNLHVAAGRGGRRPGHPGAAADAAARRRRAGHRRRAARGARQDARRRLHRLLRQGQARGVPRLALRGERLGGRALPDALLTGGTGEGCRQRWRDMASVDGVLPEKGLAKGTNWWGAFVIGLAGTILVTGIAPYVVQGTGALGIILMGVMTIAGCFLCFCLAELATMWPDRTGGIPGYATESFRPLVGDTAARHIGGVSGWAYWLGWFPVAPINVILTASYLAVLFNFSPGHLIDPVGTTWGTPIGITIVLVCFALLVLIFIPAYFGIRLGAAFATVLGVLSMLPITADDLPAVLQAELDPLGQRRRLPRAAARRRHRHVHRGLVLPDPVERDRDGGRRLLRRRMPRRRQGRQDRAHRRGHLRDVHLHRDAADVRRRAGPVAHHHRPADDVPDLHRNLRAGIVGELVHRASR